MKLFSNKDSRSNHQLLVFSSPACSDTKGPNQSAQDINTAGVEELSFPV